MKLRVLDSLAPVRPVDAVAQPKCTEERRPSADEEDEDLLDWDYRIETPSSAPPRTVRLRFVRGSYDPPRSSEQ